jgi:hypothetical protein
MQDQVIGKSNERNELSKDKMEVWDGASSYIREYKIQE